MLRFPVLTVAFGSLLLLGGCVGPEPAATSAKSTQASTAAVGKETGKKHCELVNGPKGCADDGAGAAGKSGARTDRPFAPADCVDGNYFEDMRKLSELGHRRKDWLAYCNGLEAGAKQTAAPAASATSKSKGGGNVPQDGTWYCEDSVDGAGNYGTWEMTRHPERYYDCKRVD